MDDQSIYFAAVHVAGEIRLIPLYVSHASPPSIATHPSALRSTQNKRLSY
jgi:hypothetical protein